MPNNEELQKLLNVAAQRLGTQPEQLKQQAENGTLQKMLNNLNANDAAKLQQVLSDKEAANKLLNSPQAQVLLKKFLGRKRHLGFRPTVRGSVMNPCDHPHGGGEGKSPVGRPGPVTPWGKPALGYKTRSKKHRSDKFIVKRRNGK